MLGRADSVLAPLRTQYAIIVDMHMKLMKTYFKPEKNASAGCLVCGMYR